MSSRKVVVTGMSVLSPIGNTIEAFESALFSGVSGIKSLKDEPAFLGFPVPYAGRIDGNLFDDCPSVRLRAAHAVRKMTEELCRSLPGQKLQFDAMLCAGRVPSVYDIAVHAFRNKKLPPDFLESIRPETLPRIVADALAEVGHTPPPADRQICVVNACVSGSSILGDAFQRIRAGEWKRVLAFGVEVDPNPLAMTALYTLGALTFEKVAPEAASRPFSLNRQGFVKSEGAGMLILESEEEALGRGARIFAEIAGHSSTTDAWQLTLSRDDLGGTVAAIAQAIGDAGISPADIDYINSHGTGTPAGDPQECRAIEKVFGERARNIPISALKSQTGHSTVACGLVEAIATCLMLQKQKIAPTINLAEGDQMEGFDFVPNESRDARIRYAISNTFGFGGQNNCLVFKARP